MNQDKIIGMMKDNCKDTETCKRNCMHCFHFNLKGDHFTFGNNLRTILEESDIVREKGRLLKGKTASVAGGRSGEESSYGYFVKLVNDVLKSIRSKEEDYIYNLNVLLEVYRLEPNMKFEYEDNYYKVWINK